MMVFYIFVACLIISIGTVSTRPRLTIDPAKRPERRDMMSLLADSFNGNIYKRNQIKYKTDNFPITLGRRGVIDKDVVPFNLWPRGVVRYDLSTAQPGQQQDLVLEAMKTIMEDTAVIVNRKVIPCITFRPRIYKDRAYVKFSFDKKGGCWSDVGSWVVPHNKLNLDPRYCLYSSTILHELMHTLGFQDETARPDRDKYIKINYDNVDPDFIKKFWKMKKKDAVDLHTPYDVNSILQYPANAFQKNSSGGPTIIALPGTDPIPSFNPNQRLSPIDIEEIRRVYNCKG